MEKRESAEIWGKGNKVGEEDQGKGKTRGRIKDESEEVEEEKQFERMEEALW